MARSSVTTSGAGIGRRIAGPLLAGALLLVEYLATSTSFDAYPLRQAGGALGILGALGGLVPLLVAIVTGVLLFQGAKLLRFFGDMVPPTARQLAARAAVNVVLFAVFWLVTSQVFVSGTKQDQAVTGDVPVALMVLWALCAVSVGASAAYVALPVSAMHMGRRTWLAMSGSAAVGLLAWFAGQASASLWDAWAGVTLTVSGWLVSLVYPDAFVSVEDHVMGTERFYVVIAPVCSGFESMGLVAVFLIAYLVAFPARFRYPRAALLVPLGVALAWLANNVRIFALVALGTSVSPDVALGAFHSKAGWVLFCFVGLAVAWLGQTSLFTETTEEPRPVAHEPPGSSTAAFLLPQLVLLAVGLVSGSLFAPLDRAYGLRILAAGLVLVHYRARLNLERWQAHWLPIAAGLAIVPLWVWLLPNPSAEMATEFGLQLADLSALERGAWVTLRVLGSVLVVPIVEELAFRGFLLRRIVAVDFWTVPLNRVHWSALIVSSVAFGLLHGAWIAAIGAGVVFALVQAYRGKIWDAIVAHVAANAGVAAYVVATNRFELWM